MHKVFGRSKTKDMSHKVLQKSLTHAEKLRSVRLNENPAMDDFEKVRTLGTATLPASFYSHNRIPLCTRLWAFTSIIWVGLLGASIE
jgi:hypothetical protein